MNCIIRRILLGCALVSLLAHAMSWESSGVDTKISYKADVTSSLTGGIRQESAYLGSLDIKGAFDFETMVGFTGLSATIDFLGNHGAKPSNFIGEAQLTSNIEAPSTAKLYEAYLTQKIGDAVDVSIGLLNLNETFYSLKTFEVFRNASFGVGAALAQTGVNGPSVFPTTSIATLGRYISNDEKDSDIFVGVFNAKSGDPKQPHGTHINWNDQNGYLIVGQATFGVTSLGLWSYTKQEATIDTSRAPSVNCGFYLMGEHQVSKKLSLALRYGIANPRVNRYMASAEAGLNFKGFISARPSDTFGFAVASAFAAPDFRKQNDLTTSETVLELSYKAMLQKNFSVSPDFQYIFHTGLSKTLKNALIASLRLEVRI